MPLTWFLVFDAQATTSLCQGDKIYSLPRPTVEMTPINTQNLGKEFSQILWYNVRRGRTLESGILKHSTCLQQAVV